MIDQAHRSCDGFRRASRLRLSSHPSGNEPAEAAGWVRTASPAQSSYGSEPESQGNMMKTDGVRRHSQKYDTCVAQSAMPARFIPTDRGLPRVTINPASYSQPPVKPARRKPATTGGQRRMRLQISPVR